MKIFRRKQPDIQTAEGFSEFYDAHLNYAFSVCYRHLRDKEECKDILSKLQILEVGEKGKQEIWSMIQHLSPELKSTKTQTKVIPLYRSVARYAAAACILLAAFFGARFTVPAAVAGDAPKDPTADHLFITGGNGTKGNLPGDMFKVSFEDTIRPYNNSVINKSIYVGDTS